MKVFTAYVTKKDGTRVYAKTYGKRCFCFDVDGRKKASKDHIAGKTKKTSASKQQ